MINEIRRHQNMYGNTVKIKIYYCPYCESMAFRLKKRFISDKYSPNPCSNIKDVCYNCESEKIQEFRLTWEQVYDELLVDYEEVELQEVWGIPKDVFEQKLFEILL